MIIDNFIPRTEFIETYLENKEEILSKYITSGDTDYYSELVKKYITMKDYTDKNKTTLIEF